MTDKLSRRVISNQSGPHERLEETVRKHLKYASRKPIAGHSKLAFDTFSDWLAKSDKSLILDACCGVGDSTRNLATRFPEHCVLGVDKSLKRLSKERTDFDPENMLLLRADLNDFYRLLVDNNIAIARHYILYPNPWPKSAHLARRWHGASAFADIVKIKGPLELRSNWRLYLQEFQIALRLAGQVSDITEINPENPITPFEAKYQNSGQVLWQLKAAIK